MVSFKEYVKAKLKKFWENAKPKEFLDARGYTRRREFLSFSKDEDCGLLHRKMAYSHLYYGNRHKYPRRFREYEVHHKDRNKLNNHPSNLDIVTPSQHDWIHRLNLRDVDELKEHFKNK